MMRHTTNHCCHSQNIKIKMLLVVMAAVLCLIPTSAFASSSSVSPEQKLDARNHLNSLNKPPVKSIKSPDGDVIDCVSFTHQPAFDHPLLKNHTIQMRPSFYPEGVSPLRESKVISSKGKGKNRKRKMKMKRRRSKPKRPISQLWHLNGRCPKGTVPIRRTTEEDVLRASSVQNYGKKKSHPPFTKKTQTLLTSAQPDLITQSGHQHAIVYVEGKYYGAKATINVWAPKAQQPNEFSLSQIWILGGIFGQDLNSIEAGWQVSPDLYGDNRTRLFTYWTSDAYQATGCYNLLCTGFIQTDNEIAMGATIYPVSGYGGPQYDINLLIWKDPNEGNWWLQFGNKYMVGYWPAFLFSYLVDSASMIEWGGEVVNSEPDGEHTTTQMGSGHFPEEGFGKSGYFKNIQVVDGINKFRDPKGLAVYTEQPSCYNARYGKTGEWGTYFYYGGPGRNPNCP